MTMTVSLARYVCLAVALGTTLTLNSGVSDGGGGGGGGGGGLLVAEASPMPAPVTRGHSLSKRSFFDIQCKGVYDKSIFARLDRICEDCYNLFREAELHSLCRKECFTSDYFKGCLDVLLLQDEMEKIQTWIKQLHGADPF